jgi:hypothetical protein
VAIETKSIQIRRGNEADYDKTKMLPAEFAAFLDQKKLKFAFAPNDDKEVAFKDSVDAVQANLDSAVSELEDEIEAVASQPARFS